MKIAQKDIDERANLTSTNKFELLLFRLGVDSALGKSELFGINVFKIREIVAMPSITPIAGAAPHSLGVVNLRGQVIPVLESHAKRADERVQLDDLRRATQVIARALHDLMT